MSTPAYLTVEEVVARYRGQVSEGTLRNWRAMRIGPSFIKIGKAVLYPVSELDRWDKSNLVICRPSRSLSLEEHAPAR
ncbi:helix-turn-helix transcriptional regulator [Bosea lathyri]|uniref:Helix-turn-helix domain-containing protein n=1 Tax=Bosea lathyri TaxID=1036778 RepID=A0A1H5XV12_9HYPH|nr:helix-turn-helix domain-containing protein [Bosea lathyri]SEG15609.1 Helix-turn-helix domain-containing protein [Bosea lathyri]